MEVSGPTYIVRTCSYCLVSVTNRPKYGKKVLLGLWKSIVPPSRTSYRKKSIAWSLEKYCSPLKNQLSQKKYCLVFGKELFPPQGGIPGGGAEACRLQIRTITLLASPFDVAI